MFTVTNPMVRVEPVTSARAAVFGRYPSSAMAASTRSRVSGATLGEPLMTRETVWWETPARAATSDMTSGRGAASGCTGGPPFGRRGWVRTAGVGPGAGARRGRPPAGTVDGGQREAPARRLL